MSTSTYAPMRNDRRDFDPMGKDWSYILDGPNPYVQWRELVAVNARRSTWPFELHGDRDGRSSYGSVRLAPDWAFYSWSGEYVTAWWDSGKPHTVRCDVSIGRDYPNGTGWAPRDKWEGTMVLDLREQAHTWELYPRSRDKAIPDDVAAEVASKGAKLLAFFTDACEHWRAGDQERPVQAHDLYEQAKAERLANEAAELPGAVGGLAVVHERAGWRVLHAGSGKAAHQGHLRLKKHAEQARTEMLATGVDFTRDAKAVARDHAQWRDVYVRWSVRANSHGTDLETGERYGSK